MKSKLFLLWFIITPIISLSQSWGQPVTIYSGGRHIESSWNPPVDMPTMIKTDSAGNDLLYSDLVPDSWQAVFFNFNWFPDSTIALDGGWGMYYGDSGQIAVFKFDQNGNFLDSINIQKSLYCFADAIVDRDNKLVLFQGNHSWKPIPTRHGIRFIS